MKLVYDPNYWNDYYGGSYDSTFRFGFDLFYLLKNGWDQVFDERPKSFADIGCGPGHTLVEARRLLGDDARVYGVEVQQIPNNKIKAPIIFGDFMELYHRLEPVDLLYVSCSMYIRWDEMMEFLNACCRLSNHAIYFANLYLEDGRGIPSDTLRTTIYRDRIGFQHVIESISVFHRIGGHLDFFIK